MRAPHEDGREELQEPLSRPLHRFLPPHRSRRVRRVGVGRREREDGGAGGGAGGAEDEARLQRGRLPGGGEGGAAGCPAPSRHAVEVRRLLLFCHYRHHHYW